MKLRLRQYVEEGSLRFENGAELKEVMINEDLVHPEHESIALCFRNGNFSGVIELSPKEIEVLSRAIERKKHLIKGFRKFPARK